MKTEKIVLIILELLSQIISSVPEAIALYQKIAPMLSVSAEIHPDTVTEINALAKVAIPAVKGAHDAINILVDAHGPIDPTVAAAANIVPELAVTTG